MTAVHLLQSLRKYLAFKAFSQGEEAWRKVHLCFQAVCIQRWAVLSSESQMGDGRVGMSETVSKGLFSLAVV